MSLEYLETLIGNTKLYKLNSPFGNLYTKLEYMNFFGSIKDRPAYYIIKKALQEKLIDKDTTIIESTSGNFGISLAGICSMLKIKFIPVIDPNISKEKENILRLYGCDPIRVSERDETGGYLLNRIKVVKNYTEANKNTYTPNQYTNPNNYLSYYETLGNEICQSCPRLDYAFISVSSGGTITGLSLKLKEHYRNIKIIGVDVEGSRIFNNKPAVRKLSGIGSSLRSIFFDQALIDEIVILSQTEIIEGCRNLLGQHNLFLGPSSGAAYAAAERVLEGLKKKNVTALFISPDSGTSYIDTIYSDDWVLKNITNERLKTII